MNIVTSCQLCDERALHVIGDNDSKIQQCISCGYVTNSKYKGKKEDNVEWNTLTEDMKKWSKETLGYIWIPTIMTLPDYMLYPFDDKDGVMKWGLAEMVDISKEEQKNYPIPGDSGKFYERKYDTDSAVTYEKFYEALSFINDKAKEKLAKKNERVDIKLPKTEKIKDGS